MTFEQRLDLLEKELQLEQMKQKILTMERSRREGREELEDSGGEGSGTSGAKGKGKQM